MEFMTQQHEYWLAQVKHLRWLITQKKSGTEAKQQVRKDLKIAETFAGLWQGRIMCEQDGENQ